MAIYNNREVTVNGPTRMQSLPETMSITYQDGSQETVPVGQVKFTEDEKKNLIKAYPSRFEGVTTIGDEDIKAVRAGVAPPSDPSYKEQADLKARQDEAQKINQQNIEAAQKAQTKADKK